MNKKLLLMVLGAVLVLASTPAAQAQACSGSSPICEVFWTGLSPIFIGRVIHITPVPPHSKKTQTRADNLKPQMLVRLAVERSYQKREVKQLEVETLGGSNQSPFTFAIGSRYLVFAESYPLLGTDRRLVVRPCSRTTLVTQAQEEINYLESVYKLNPAADILDFHEPVTHVPILQGKAISLPKPSYPAAARAAHASGSVLVLILLDESGRVIRAKSLCGHPLLIEAAEAAARQARFSPVKVSGKEVKISTLVNYNFVSG
jgi:TonB family protein